MTNDIILAGVGGQGILTIATIVGHAAVARGLNVKQSEIHGMAQRGGAVVAHLRLASGTIYSDLIAPGRADVVLGVEPLEALRHLGSLKPDGVLLANTVPIMNIPDYPDPTLAYAAIEAVPRHVLLDADGLAKAAGSARAMNMVMLGALSACLDLPRGALEDMVRQVFARKGEDVVAVNLKAFAAGVAAAAKAKA